MHIPFLVKWPDVSKAGSSSQALISTIDLLPTFLDVAGAKKPDELPGKSVRPVVADPSADLREYMFGEFTAHLPADYYPRRTVRNTRYQLIENLLSPAPNPTPGIEGLAERNAVKVDGMVTSPSKQAIEDYVKPPRYELFDLKNDPENFTNLAGKPEYKATQDKLQAALDAWRKRSNDPLLKPGEIERVGKDIKARLDTKNSGIKGGKKKGKQKKGRPVNPE
jgi:N-sulfoglucosamine sulfohydrolase